MTASHTRQPWKSREERENRGWKRQRLVLCSYKLRNSRGCQTSTLSREESRKGFKVYLAHLASRVLHPSTYMVLIYTVCGILLYSSRKPIHIHLCFFFLIKFLQKLMNAQEGDFISAFRILWVIACMTLRECCGSLEGSVLLTQRI